MEEMQIKTSLFELPDSGTLTIPYDGKDVEQQELSYIAGGNTKWYSNFGRWFGDFLQN